MYKNKKISVVFPAYNEEENIAAAILDFRKLKIIDEILVIDNNSKDKTNKIAKSKKAKVIKETKQGYGYALRKGLREAKGDLIVLCEPDGTFLAKDLLRLLRYTEKYDLVMGTRTNKQYVGKNANMKGALRLGNVLLAKIMQVIYRPFVSLTDCGCTFRVINKKSLKLIYPKFSVGGSFFLSEFTVLSLKNRLSVKEIPVHYRERVGESKITGSLKKSVIVGIQMFKIILSYRFVN
ncbi:MAG: glycosyltransferase family 2 protein [Candidatus Levybacteria bacterium]|nr:glycosyltransferase family 2 protein [Candidatus Levybacteria bacterium]